MEFMREKTQIVSDVLPGSPAARAGVHKGDALLAINGEPVFDLIDYEHLSTSERLTLALRAPDGAQRTVSLQKDEYEPLGLCFATSLMDDMRTCKNHCVFCFIDQMPKGVRTSLHVKDDDWRMSFIMGNYITLTNLSEAEIGRIIRRKVSPLYVSLHASDPDVRVAMMKNPNAGEAMRQLKRLKEAGIRFHLQAVVCPGINDGDVLRRTVEDAAALRPAAQSIAIVPVGLTKFRDGLNPLRTFTPEECRDMIAAYEPIQEEFLKKRGSRFVFLADEWYTKAGLSLPSYETYEDFPQIENGVGLLRLFEGEFREALAEKIPLPRKRRFLMAGGVSAEPFFRELYRELLFYNVEVGTRAVRNDYFGESVTVGGLITGGDLIKQLSGVDAGEALLIPRAMLKADEDVFLDGMSLSEAEKSLHTNIIPVSDGEDFIEVLFAERNAAEKRN